MKFLLLALLSTVGVCWAGYPACEEHCSASYPLHTFPKPAYSCACSRGCRIAIVDAYLSDRPSTTCNETCNEAYSEDVERAYACSIGCNVDTTVVSSQLLVESYTSEQWVFTNMVMAMLSIQSMLQPSPGVSGTAVAGWGTVDAIAMDTSAENASDSDVKVIDGSIAYSMFWSVEPAAPMDSLGSDSQQSQDDSDSYYLVFRQQNRLEVFSQLLCFTAFILTCYVTIRCCITLSGSADQDDESVGLSVQSSEDGDCDDTDGKMAPPLPVKKGQPSDQVSELRQQLVRKPDYQGDLILPQIIPVQNTPLSSPKVEGILTIV